MQVDYAPAMNLALELRDIGTTDRSRYIETTDRYSTAITVLVDDLLSAHIRADTASDAARRDLDEIALASEDDLRPVYDKVRYDIVRRIDDVAGPTPAQQAMKTRLVGLAGVAFVLLFAAGYAGVRQYSATPVVDPIDSRSGIHQRADALNKVIRYEGFGAGGGLIKNVLLWPIEPTSVEGRNAGEFGGLILAGARRLLDDGEACKLPLTTSGPLSDGEVELLTAVTAYLRDDTTNWRAPPIMTILDPIRNKYPCGILS